MGYSLVNNTRQNTISIVHSLKTIRWSNCYECHVFCQLSKGFLVWSWLREILSKKIARQGRAIFSFFLITISTKLCS